MSWTDWAELGPPLIRFVFVLALGACVGSLINVLVYRLPLGMSVISPPSRCPSCDTRLTFRENIPIFGWLLLRGKCRFCDAKISPEYPIVETVTALLFATVFVLWHWVEPGATVLGVPVGAARPWWTLNAPAFMTWPATAVALTLISCLIAMTLIDARTYTIPLILTWVPAVVAAVVHPLHALIVSLRHDGLVLSESAWMADAGGRWLFGDGGVWATAPGWLWTIETGGPTQWSWIGGSAGAVLGLGGSALLVRFGLLGRSFEDYEEWEREAEAREKAEAEQAKQESAEGEGGGPASDDDEGRGAQGAQTPGGASSPLASSPASASDDPAAMWIRYPHARREMLKEVAFLGAPAVLGTVGWVLAGQLGGPAWEIGSQAPLWLVVLGGVLCGYLVGGGLVWGVRIFGSLAFGKEAMGLGDVHLMAAVGACVGWVDAVVAFFVAAFLALGHAVLGAVFGGAMRRAMPFGPFLAGGTVLVLLGRPVVEWGLGLIMASDGPVRLP